MTKKQSIISLIASLALVFFPAFQKRHGKLSQPGKTTTCSSRNCLSNRVGNPVLFDGNFVLAYLKRTDSDLFDQRSFALHPAFALFCSAFGKLLLVHSVFPIWLVSVCFFLAAPVNLSGIQNDSLL